MHIEKDEKIEIQEGLTVHSIGERHVFPEGSWWEVHVSDGNLVVHDSEGTELAEYRCGDWSAVRRHRKSHVS